MTISPPAKVKTFECENVQVLSSNLDKLDLSIDVQWFSDDFFKHLEKAKKMAQNTRKEISLELKPLIGEEEWACSIKPHGTNGYAWMLESQEFVLKIGKWLKPQDRPSIFAEIRSETLWRLGPEITLERIINIIKGQGKGAIVESIKPSRVDLCLDLFVPAKLWNAELHKYAVMRARKSSIHFHSGDKLEGISIGRGKIAARLYNKPLEIQQQSKKYWMYDIWRIEKDKLPDDKRIIRVEFQLRREAITELGIDTVSELLEHQPNMWAHCTQKWLKFRDRPGKHHTQRKTFNWWKAVQNGYHGVKAPNPLIRHKAMAGKYEDLVSQVDGCLTTIEAVNMEEFNPDGNLQPVRSIAVNSFCRAADALGKGPMHFMDAVNEKRVKIKRSKEKSLDVHQKRMLFGFPSNIDVGDKNEAVQEVK